MLHSPEFVEISDVPLVLVSESQVVGLSGVMGLSSGSGSVRSDGVSPGSDGVVVPSLSVGNGSSVSSVEGLPRWLGESRSDMSNSMELLFPESVEISDVPSVLVGSSQVAGLSSMVMLSSGHVSVSVGSVSPGSDSALIPSSSVLDGVSVRSLELAP